MLVKYKHAEYFIASAAEFSRIKVWSDIFELMEKYEVSASYGGFEMVFALSRLFFSDEKHISQEISSKIPDISRMFQLDREFTNKIASYKKEEMDSFAYRLREDEYCRQNEFVGMGLWNFFV